MTINKLSLNFDLTFQDLYTRTGLVQLDSYFQAFLIEIDPTLSHQYEQARAHPALGSSDLIITLAPVVEDFLSTLFKIQKEVHQCQQNHHQLAPLYSVKRLFVQRQALRRYTADQLAFITEQEAVQALSLYLPLNWDCLLFATSVARWMTDEEIYSKELEAAAYYAAWAVLTPAGQKKHGQHILFTIPHKKDSTNLIPHAYQEGSWSLPSSHHRNRDGFSLTDSGLNLEQALDEATYCIWCHPQGKDSCSKGMKPKNKQSCDPFHVNEEGVSLTGCPLEEKISEMNQVKAQGYTLGALAIIIIDNPMVAGTGHRICNDCMKACIFQKQDPVNIPGVETSILDQVLSLPWGFEIYSLLTRWNPLNFHRPLPLEATGYKVLVVGTGPAGYTLSHHLMNDGHEVVAIDGLKIEPLPMWLNGLTPEGDRTFFDPIYSVESLSEDLHTRINGGFGGVAEYGITVRWNKNYLKIIRLLLERRSEFLLFGGVRFGGTLTPDQAFQLGFDHIALCMGAGSPTLIPLENGLAKGVRQASDFLMALQLTGAAKEDSLANLQIQLPAVVIGGGLTAIDTATELMAYYPLQVEKFLKRYKILVHEKSESAVRAPWSASEQQIADQFCSHGARIQQERDQAQKEGRPPYFIPLLQEWGGVTVIYRRDFKQAPSYRLNHEEVLKALEEGIFIADQLTPVRVVVDEAGAVNGLAVSPSALPLGEKEKIIPARSLIIAAGTKPNTNLHHDSPDFGLMDGLNFQAFDEEGLRVSPERCAKPVHVSVLMHTQPNGKSISFFGDLHPSFAGNVVKAMASAKRGYPVVSRVLAKFPPILAPYLIKTLNKGLRPTIQEVNRLTPTIVEIVIKAPFAAAAFRPGQFYRLQNYETTAPTVYNTRLVMEGCALTGAKAHAEKGLLSTIVLEMGGSSSLCRLLNPGDPVVLMGPTGAPTHLPSKETVLLIGGGLGNAVLFSIGQELRQKGCQVLYVAGYKQVKDRYKIEEIEAAADVVIWCCDEAPGFIPSRPQDVSMVGNIIEALLAYEKGELGSPLINLQAIDRLLVIGSDRLMGAVAQARKTVLYDLLKPNHLAFGSINSPMQCMMKEICAQCLQRQVDPLTGREKIVYSCANQDQDLDWVDFKNLSNRLTQNSVHEKLTAQWITHCLAYYDTQ